MCVHAAHPGSLLQRVGESIPKMLASNIPTCRSKSYKVRGSHDDHAGPDEVSCIVKVVSVDA